MATVTTDTPPADVQRLLAPARLTAFGAAVLEATGSLPSEASAVAAHLVASDLAGHPSHGIGLVPMYVDHRLRDEVVPNATATIVADAGALVTVSGHRGYGRPAGEYAMRLGIERAREHGICAIALRDAHHLGRIGAFGEMIAAEGLIAIQFVSVQALAPLVAPHGGIAAKLSTNPVCIAVPRAIEGPLLLDASTSAIANNKARVAFQAGMQLPPGSIIDHRGNPTRDPAVMIHHPRGAILPLGGHKGYGLALLCEVLAGILSGAGAINDREITNGIVNNMLTIVLDPGKLAGGARAAADIERLLAYVLSGEPADAASPVLFPGQPEIAARAQASARGGVPLAEATIAAMLAAAGLAGVARAEAEMLLC